MAESPYQQLEAEWRRLHAFRGASSLLRWDAAVMMPRGSAEVRGEQLAALETECHALLTAPKTSRLIERAEANAGTLDEWQKANLREMRRQRDRAFALPVALVRRLAKVVAQAETRWAEARRANDFMLVAPHLTEVVQLVRDKAALLGRALSLAPYDALLDEHSPGVTSADIDALFKPLARKLPDMIREAMAAQARQPALPLSGKFTTGRQRALAVEVMKALGFPFDRGRLDESEHPFTEGVAGDIRVTTRFDAVDPFMGLLGVLHETGHALYDLGTPPEWRDQPVGRDRGMALEESQSLLLEMMLGRSRPFATYLAPLLAKHHSVNGAEWEAGNVFRLLSRVSIGQIRVDADEMSYPLHIMQRYELETRLLGGQLPVRELPEVWNAGMERRFGRAPANYREGCLQDVHWALGSFGYFPAYVLGAVIAAQLWEAAHAQLDALEDGVARGDFSALLNWLRDNVHSRGAKLQVKDLVKQVTGQPLGANALLRYLGSKYLEATA